MSDKVNQTLSKEDDHLTVDPAEVSYIMVLLAWTELCVGDRETGKDLLQAVIKDENPEGVDEQWAKYSILECRALAHALLIVDAAEHGDFEGVLNLQEQTKTIFSKISSNSLDAASLYARYLHHSSPQYANSPLSPVSLEEKELVQSARKVVVSVNLLLKRRLEQTILLQ
jgi:hypothetical protein